MKFTHIGQLSGDARTGNRKPWLKLRETNKFWVDEHGQKYRKTSGYPTGNDPWPMWHLNLETVKEAS